MCLGVAGPDRDMEGQAVRHTSEIIAAIQYAIGAVATTTVAASGTAVWAQVDSWPELMERWGLPTFLLLAFLYLVWLAIKHGFALLDKYAAQLMAAAIDWIAKDAAARERAAAAAERAAEREAHTLTALQEIQRRLERKD